MSLPTFRLPGLGRRKAGPSRFGASGFGSSTLAEIAWHRTRNAAARWGAWGAALGVLVGVVAFAPASWLASAVESASGGKLLLTEAQGTVWSGSAAPVLTGGPGSRDAAALPGRLNWTLTPSWNGLWLRLSQSCCIAGDLALQVKPGLNRVTVVLPPRAQLVGQWPAAWLGGLGTPWNTLQLGGNVRVSSSGMTLESVEGRWRLTGSADVELQNVSSRLATLDTLGSYRFTVRGNAASGDAATLSLDTVEGALRLSGSGQWAGKGMRFRGEARAAEGQEAALSNLLNIIGKRQGALSVISIG